MWLTIYCQLKNKTGGIYTEDVITHSKFAWSIASLEDAEMIEQDGSTQQVLWVEEHTPTADVAQDLSQQKQFKMIKFGDDPSRSRLQFIVVLLCVAKKRSSLRQCTDNNIIVKFKKPSMLC